MHPENLIRGDGTHFTIVELVEEDRGWVESDPFMGANLNIHITH